MKLVWSNEPNGVVSVSWDGENYVVPILAGKQAEAGTRAIARWEPLITEICATTRGYEGMPLPVPYAVAVVISESQGYERAFRKELDKNGKPRVDQNGRPLTGVGLTQITAPGLKGSHSDEELFEPRLNLTIGLRHLANYWRTGIDLVATASMYNAGAMQNGRPWPSEKSPYGFREYMEFGKHGEITYDHITQVLRANNYYVLRGSGIGYTGDVANQVPQPPSSPPASPAAAIAAREPKHDPFMGALLAGALFALEAT